MCFLATAVPFMNYEITLEGKYNRSKKAMHTGSFLQITHAMITVHFITDFKFIGKDESRTNKFYKISVLAHFKLILFKKSIGSLIYMPNIPH